MATKLATATQNASADAVGALASAGTLEIRSGTRPASANDAATGTLLASVTLGSAGAASSGTVSFGDPASVNASATGTASWFRVKASGGATVWDGDVATSGAELNLSSTSLTSGSPVDISSFTYTQPAS